MREPSWKNFIKEALVDLALTIVIACIFHYVLVAAGYDEIRMVEDGVGWIVDFLGVYR